MTEDYTRTVSIVLTDHAGSTDTRAFGFASLSSSTSGKYSAAWYWFNPTNFNILSLDAVAGVTSMSFVVDGTVEDQGGIGFALQDGFMMSQTSCSSGAPEVGRIDIAVRNGVNPTRLYLESITRDSVQRVVVTEIDLTPPVNPVVVKSAYVLWSLNLTDQSLEFTLGAEIDGVKYSTLNVLNFEEFPPCSEWGLGDIVGLID
ncbi:hypothetical protein C8R45DRAFT_1099388 [Mycena sanguinolenta]|nr:hypothetical protein C8R45DRAFT_1099388 [Mycena sanguinolenta]